MLIKNKILKICAIIFAFYIGYHLIVNIIENLLSGNITIPQELRE
jgi:phage-related holin